MGIVSIIAAGFVALASQAGQSVQQWTNSPSGKKAINNAIQTVGQGVIQEVFKKLDL